MTEINRRRLLQVAGASAAATVFSDTVARAAALPASRRHGSIQDVEHIVVLTQENRSFDTYFGALRGVRGFGDPHPAMLSSGKDVWHQSDATREVLPFHPDVPDLGSRFVVDLDHSWGATHEAFGNGRYDQWLKTKTPATMAHFRRDDIPWYYGLADSFTICDAYYSSLLGPTDPNRYYMWTGWDGNDGTGGGPDLWNGEVGYSWTTYPERLQQAGISWKVYQDSGVGLDQAGFWGWTSDPYIGNYGDNSLLYFKQYQNAAPGTPLFDRARVGTDARHGDDFFRILREDVRSGNLPQISYIAAPEAYSEHGNWPVNYGIWYAAKVLEILTSNPEVWSKTAFIINYDENDGFFDHLVPPHPNTPQIPGASTVSTEDEYYAGADDVPGHFGLGVRVPMLVLSPWSTGGWVCSETFDHTSIIRFMERRFGVHEPNISTWRRSVCGDLTSAFDFGHRRMALPTLPATGDLAPPDRLRHDDYVPVPPARQRMPKQESGVRPSRPLGYRLDVAARVRQATLGVEFSNTGRLGAHVQVRSTSLAGAPYSYTIGAGDSLEASWPLGESYDVSLHGPNGFFRRYAGTTSTTPVDVDLRSGRSGDRVHLDVTNTGGGTVRVQVADAYSKRSTTVELRAGRSRAISVDTTGGWYDVTLTSGGDAAWVRQLAGRVETGRAGISDPQLAH